MEVDSPKKSNFSTENNSLELPDQCYASCQSSPELICSDNDNDTFENFNVNLDELKESEGYICVQSLDVNKHCNCGCTDIITQLIIRDKLLCILRRYLQDFLKQGRLLEKERKSLNSKNENLSEEIRQLEKTLKKKEKLMKKLHKRNKCKIKMCSKPTQTLNPTCHTFTQTDIDLMCKFDWHPQQENCTNILQHKNEITHKEEFCEDQFISSETNEIGMLINHIGIDDSKDNCSEFTQTNDGSVSSNNVDMELLHKEACLPGKNGNNDSGWDSTNVKEEVQAVAEEITSQLGYVFIDEIGMYYDHSSGYYYDDKTSLFYDGKTGTYFYYDHQTNNYEFYAQVDPNPSAVTETSTEIQNRKRKVPKMKDTDKEEGECSDSEEENEESDETKDVSPVPVPNEAESSIATLPVDFNERLSTMEVAPSLRLMVMNGTLKGNLHIVTLDGGTIGREGDVEVLLKSPSVSKLHAEISYQSDGPSDHHYFIKDLGSSNGTLVRGQRISESKMSSELVELGHSWEIQCGEVILSCHIHPGLLTCNECEPGLVEGNGKGNAKASSSNRQSKHTLEKDRRRQNKAIRKKFSLGWFEETPPTNPAYKDRAIKRREVVGSDNPYEKTQVASIETNLTKDNKGFQLLQKMGWSEGQSLGTSDTGITEPVVPSIVSGRTGLGAVSLPQEVSRNSGKNNTYHKMAEITRKRYNNADSVEEIRFVSASHNSNGS